MLLESRLLLCAWVLAILTNCFVPCNGRFPFLITIATIFFGGITGGFSSSIIATIVVLFVIVLGVFMTLFVSKILSKTILKGIPFSFTLELPPYRKPKIFETIVRSIFDKTILVLGRAIAIAAPAGLVIWLFANIQINDISILTYFANFFDPFGKLLGLDGYIITAFLLGLPANEIVLPIILMSYAKTGTLLHLENLENISQILLNNGWTLLTDYVINAFSMRNYFNDNKKRNWQFKIHNTCIFNSYCLWNYLMLINNCYLEYFSNNFSYLML